MDLTEFLKFLPVDLGGLAAFLVGAAAFALILSFFLERMSWFQALGAKTKAWLVLALIFFLPILGWLLQALLWVLSPVIYPPPSVPIGEPLVIWLNFAYVFTVKCLFIFAGTQYVHSIDPATKDAKLAITSGTEDAVAASRHLLL